MTDVTPVLETSEEPQPKRSKKRVAAGAAGVVVLASAVGGGAFAFNMLSGGGPQPADVLPANTQIYLRIDLDPSASQKIELFNLVNNIPEVGEELGIEDADAADIRELVFDSISQDACPDIDYENDIDPWLGERAGVGINIDDEQFAVAVQVTDQSAAEDGIAAIFDCTGADYGIGFRDGFALISDTQGTVDDVLDAAAEGTLTTNDAFAESMDALGEQGIASVWVNVPELADSLPNLLQSTGVPMDPAELDQIAAAGPVAGAMRVDGNAIEFAGVADEVEALDQSTFPIADLPSDSLVGLSVTGTGTAITDQWDTFMDQLAMGVPAAGFGVDVEAPATTQPTPDLGMDEEFLDSLDPETRDLYEQMMEDTAPVDDFGTTDDFGTADDFGTSPFGTPEDIVTAIQDETGLVLPEDLETLLGTSFALSIGGEGMADLPNSQGPEVLDTLNIALHAGGEPGEVNDVLTKISDYINSQAGTSLVTQEDESGAILATNEGAAKSLAEGGDLGGNDAFSSVMPLGDDATQALFIDVEGILQTVLDADPPADVRSEIEKWNVFEAVGVSAGNKDGKSHFSFRISFVD